eukprot:4666454-Prymnesium_polylepis.1
MRHDRAIKALQTLQALGFRCIPIFTRHLMRNLSSKPESWSSCFTVSAAGCEVKTSRKAGSSRQAKTAKYQSAQPTAHHAVRCAAVCECSALSRCKTRGRGQTFQPRALAAKPNM